MWAWDPKGCVWVRKSTEGDVLHGQKAGYPGSHLLTDGYQIRLKTNCIDSPP